MILWMRQNFALCLKFLYLERQRGRLLADMITVKNPEGGTEPGETEERPVSWRRWPVVSSWLHRWDLEKALRCGEQQVGRDLKKTWQKSQDREGSLGPSHLLPTSAFLLVVPLELSKVLAKGGKFPLKIKCNGMSQHGEHFPIFWHIINLFCILLGSF